MRIDETTGHVHLERKDCGNCRCYDGTRLPNCERCGGAWQSAEPERGGEMIPASWAERFRYHVVRFDGHVPEAYWPATRGHCAFWSSSDYGDAWKADDAALVDKVRAEMPGALNRPQLSKMARPIRQAPEVNYADIRHLPTDECIARYAAAEAERCAIPLEPCWDVVIIVQPYGYEVRALFPGIAEALGVSLAAA